MNPKMGLMPVLIFNLREKMKNVLKYDMLLKEEYPVENPSVIKTAIVRNGKQSTLDINLRFGRGWLDDICIQNRDDEE